MRCRWRAGAPLYEHAEGARRQRAAGPVRRRSRSELDRAGEQTGRATCPQGVIHADLFPDNVFFLGDRLSGLIDFYFACTDTLAYDVAICLNAWCFEPDHSYNVTKGRALLQAYGKVRALSAPERAALPLLARGAAHALSADAAGRLAGRAGRRAGQAEGPAGIFPQAALPPVGQERAATTASIDERSSASPSTPTAPARAIPGRAAGARSCRSATTRRN